MPERRRLALAMMSAIDDGVGAVMKRLDELNLDENTLIFFLSDNGAPLKMHKEDKKPYTTPGWDGSLNDPFVGEKGMLAEGGIRIPFIARWKSKIQAGQEISEPVISVDIGATAAAVSGCDSTDFDGINLLPLMTGSVDHLPERNLYWRFWRQAAIRKGNWKYLYTSDGKEWLFDLVADHKEQVNLLSEYPEKANKLRKSLEIWTQTLRRPGMPEGKLNSAEP